MKENDLEFSNPLNLTKGKGSLLSSRVFKVALSVDVFFDKK